MYCATCGRECEPTTIDVGVGIYEYAGVRGFHSDERTVSDCCEDDLWTESEHEEYLAEKEADRD